MAASRQYTPARRMMMQAVMWLILGATVAVAAIITSHRRNQFEVKLTRTVSSRQLSVQLPGKWRITPSSNPLSPTIFTAVEQGGDDEQSSPRVIHIIREPLSERPTPIEYVAMQMPAGEKEFDTDGEPQTVTIANSTGVLVTAMVQHPVKSVQDMLRGRSIGKVVVAAAVPPSGRGIAVMLEGDGQPESDDLDLVQRIAETIKLSDEPSLGSEKQIALGDGMQIGVPDGYGPVQIPDPLCTARRLLSRDASEWRSIELIPIVLSDKDGAETVSTMLSLCDSDFATADPHRDANGVWLVDAQAPLNSRAYAVAKDGQGFIAIFKGGKDDQWIEGVWQTLSASIHWPADNSTNSLIAAGTEQAKRITDAGLAKLLPPEPAEQWWLDCLGDPSKPLGWVHFEPATNGGRIESHMRLPDRWIQRNVYSWHGSVDLKSSYRANNESTLTLFMNGTSDSEKQNRSTSATLSKSKLELSNRGGQAGDRDLTYSVPANYVPGGWLPDIIATVSDKPVILRVDSFFDFPDAQCTDLMTVTLRPLPPTTRPTTRPTSEGESAGPLKAVSVEVSGSGVRSTWYILADGTLDGIDYAEGQRLIRRDQNDLMLDFGREQEMKPQ